MGGLTDRIGVLAVEYLRLKMFSIPPNTLRRSLIAYETKESI